MANGKLPEELHMEILCRLPVKSLLRSKSVCKNWYSLIRNPAFISLRSKHSAENTDCLLVKRSLNGGACLSFVPNETTVEDIDISFTGLESLDIRDLQLLGPCNGVVCLAKGWFNSTMVICNPSMREFRVLPRPSHKKDHENNMGFGFDPSTNDYKVVKFGVLDRNSNNLLLEVGKTFEIYDLSTDSWRKVDVNPHNIGFDLDFNFLKCTSWKGGCYWYISCSDGADAIIVFRLTDEVFDEIPVPEVSLANSYTTERELFILDDSLAMVRYPSEWLHPSGLTRGYIPLMKCFGVWVMDEDGVEVSWTKKLTIGPLQGPNFALGFRRNGEFLCETGGGQMVSYHIDTQHIKEYQVYGDPTPERLQVIVYTESLISVKSNNKHDAHDGLNM
ncbi:putative F-box protein At3g24700 [Rhododendron vialii]|uniref:putative F-box protein At3g24700 n=1 Tax=Rhododendron vialii TaxID=182163 RepID=UPI00265EB53E|nr:putative F-box protein At3g24700 [Rhododendron vialii]XP_058187816.1 putative F-box protein At3g24700 [Rhododendron vialii]XP_058187818.1 putative F-box protein At3g24700 [Rhododendron vialii]